MLVDPPRSWSVQWNHPMNRVPKSIVTSVSPQEANFLCISTTLAIRWRFAYLFTTKLLIACADLWFLQVPQRAPRVRSHQLLRRKFLVDKSKELSNKESLPSAKCESSQMVLFDGHLGRDKNGPSCLPEMVQFWHVLVLLRKCLFASPLHGVQQSGSVSCNEIQQDQTTSDNVQASKTEPVLTNFSMSRVNQQWLLDPNLTLFDSTITKSPQSNREYQLLLELDSNHLNSCNDSHLHSFGGKYVCAPPLTGFWTKKVRSCSERKSTSSVYSHINQLLLLQIKYLSPSQRWIESAICMWTNGVASAISMHSLNNQWFRVRSGRVRLGR